MDVFSLRDRLVQDYAAYIRSFINIRDERIRAKVADEMNAGLLWPEPLLQLNPSFEHGPTIDDLVEEGVLHPLCRQIFRLNKQKPGQEKPLRLYRHQADAVRAARTGENYALTTGTGSGKSLAYIVPIVDHVLRHGSGKGVQAIIVFLVLDELHTYRGRQGADVGLLVRRVRERLNAHDLQCVGTSATLSTEGSYEGRQASVARMASRLFGSEVKPSLVLGETLRRATPDRDFGEGGFLYIRSSDPWPEDEQEVIRRVPDDWLEAHGTGYRVRRDRRKYLPLPIRLLPDGTEIPTPEEGHPAHFVTAPFRFCLHCGVAYEPRQRSDFAKLATLSSEGRSTATTILSLAAVRGLKEEDDLDEKEEAFRSLLTLLDRDFSKLPPDLTGSHNEHHRRRLAEHFVQRRRADIRGADDWLEDTPFPEREEAEATYELTAAYKRLFDKVLDYTRETVRDVEGSAHRQRVRWWSALALLRSLASSPAAAASTLRRRAASADTVTAEEADEIGRHRVLDLIDDESVEGMDVVHGSDPAEEGEEGQRLRRRLLDLAREADRLRGEEDAKLEKAVELVRTLVTGGYRPILFCRFVPTAEYVAEALRERLRGVAVEAVTGLLAPAEREARVLELSTADRPVLVATDCLSEGINLQAHFDAVVHYDLSWNPTRHEQREGRVDRYGQPRETVRVVTYYGRDNQIDGIVLDVLLRKHKTIRNALGISVPVPMDSNQVVEAIFEGLVLRGSRVSVEQLNLFEDLMEERDQLHTQWELASEKEKASRTMFAQRGIKVDDVARELKAVREAMGSHLDVARFVDEAVRLYGGIVQPGGAVTLKLEETPRALRDILGGRTKLKARFEMPVQEGEVYLSRTHPFVEGLATYVMDTALEGMGKTSRCSVIRTRRAERRTTSLVVRFRYHIHVQREGREYPLLAEDCRVLAFEGAPEEAEWLSDEAALDLFSAEPDANINPDQARHFLQRLIDAFDAVEPHLEEVAYRRGEELLEAHRRVRTAARARGSYRVEPKLPPDVLGIYVFLPV